MTCACVLGGGDQAGNYKNNGIYTQTSTHTHTHNFFYNQSVLKIRVQEIDLVSKKNQSDINQLKEELDYVQSGNLSIREGQLWKIATRAQQFDLLCEKIRVKDKMEKE